MFLLILIHILFQEMIKKDEDGHYHHDFRYLFTIDRLDDIKIDFNESNDYKWVSVSDLENDERFAHIIKKIKKIIKSKTMA